MARVVLAEWVTGVLVLRSEAGASIAGSSLYALAAEGCGFVTWIAGIGKNAAAEITGARNHFSNFNSIIYVKTEFQLERT